MKDSTDIPRVGVVFGRRISRGWYEGRFATPQEIADHECRIANITEGESATEFGSARTGIIIGKRDGNMPVVAAHDNFVS